MTNINGKNQKYIRNMYNVQKLDDNLQNDKVYLK